MPQVTVNLTALERQLQIARNGMISGSTDSKRPNAWCEYGYPAVVDFPMLLNLYERHGVAHGIVHRLLDKCWETKPWIIQGADEDDNKRAETPWETDVARLFKKLKVWKAFKEADRLRLVGHYSGILLQIRDNKTWDQPVSSGVLERLVPAWEGQLEPATWDTNAQSPTFGDVLTWNYNEAQVQENDQRSPGRSVTVHRDRVYIVGSYRTGVPLLKAGYNDCINIEKVLGGSGESFLKNAARQVTINFDKEADVAGGLGVAPDEVQGVFDDVTKGLNRGNDAALVTQGAQVGTLVASTPDPEKPFDIALQSVAASVQMPSKIIVGNQTGERASTEDLRDFNKRGQGRRVNELDDDIDGFVNHLMRFKLLPAVPGGDFTVMWDNLAEATAAERLANGKTLAETNKLGEAQGENYFTIDEVREAAGYEAAVAVTALPDTAPTDDELLGVV